MGLVAFSFIILSLTLFHLSNAVGNNCNFHQVKLSHGTTFSTQLSIFGQAVQVSCEMESDCPADIFMYYKSEPDLGRPVIDDFFVIKRNLNFKEVVYAHGGNKYNATVYITVFSSSYSGEYYCVISEKGNPSNFATSAKMRILTSPGAAQIPLTNKPCYSPRAYNITVVPTLTNGTITVSLSWSSTLKTEPDNVYCAGGRRWRVYYKTYKHVADTPPDEQFPDSLEKNKDGIQWQIVDSRNKSFEFSNHFNNYTYYQFFVANRPDPAERFTQYSASSIFYFGQQRTPDIVRRSSDSSFTFDRNTDAEITCRADGFPKPSLRWLFVDDFTSQLITRPNQDGSLTLHLKNISTSNKGTYMCFADNVLVNPPLGKRNPLAFWEINIKVNTLHSADGMSCKSDLTTYCNRDYLHPQFFIYINASRQDDLHGAVGIQMTEIEKYVKSVKCRDIIRSMLCHSTYPYCDVSQANVPIPRPICNESCNRILNDTECKSYIEKIEESNPQLYKMMTSGCSRMRLDGGTTPECLPLSVNTSKTDQHESFRHTGQCVMGNGRGYVGTVARTTSNKRCQLWSVQLPHSHPMLPAIYTTDLIGAENYCRNPGGLGDRPWCYTTDPKTRWEYCDIATCDSCEVYSGTVCASINGYNSNRTVLIRKGERIAGWSDIERKVLQVVTRSLSVHRATKGCEDILRVLLCKVSFPLCDRSNKEVNTCADQHCRLVQSLKDHCLDSYNEYIQFTSQNTAFTSDITCPSKDTLHCDNTTIVIPSSRDGSSANATTDTCYTFKGTNYRGNISTTSSGLPCQPWSSDIPHEHSTKPTAYPELADAGNHCRNPGGLHDRPWCYTTSRGVTWDYCNVPSCNDVRLSPQGPDSLPSAGNLDNNDGHFNSTLASLVGVLLVAMAIVVVAITAAIFVLIVLKRRSNMLRMRKHEKAASRAISFIKDDSYRNNPGYYQINLNSSSSSNHKIPENFKVIDAKQIKYVSQLGQGNFGVVFKGRAFNVLPDVEEIDVAVKTLKEEASTEVVQNFIDEAKLMFSFDHPNILSIFGVCMSEMPYQMVFEYMNEGDLTQFLRQRASSTQRRLVNPFSYRSRTESCYSNEPPSLSKSQLLYICTQIADGMKYLSEMKHVHRDLACRNCLVSSDFTVKIGDFGMSRNLYSRDYYRINGNAVLPVRWMSPESLIYGKFSIEGDVWSFGVVMWEVFSFGLQPYYGISNEQVTEHIRHGKTLNRPDNCPAEIYKTMKECWNMDPYERPSFAELHAGLTELYQSAGSDTDDEDGSSLFSGDSESQSDDAFYPDNLPMDDTPSSFDMKQISMFN